MAELTIFFWNFQGKNNNFASSYKSSGRDVHGLFLAVTEVI